MDHCQIATTFRFILKKVQYDLQDLWIHALGRCNMIDKTFKFILQGGVFLYQSIKSVQKHIKGLYYMISYWF